MANQDEGLLNISEWRALGFRPKNGEEPRTTLSRYGGGVLKLFDRSQIQPIRTKKRRPPEELPLTPENVARACWIVNRTAKRYRDSASKHYSGGRHGLARTSSEKKQDLYGLKDRAVAWLAGRDLLKAERIHGGVCLWTGVGYSFHSTLAPHDLAIPETDEPLLIESKPKGRGEMRLIDAEALLERVEDVTGKFVRLEAPRVPRTEREVICRRCGRAGHIAAACPASLGSKEDFEDEFEDEDDW
jgi:hypothetical protein